MIEALARVQEEIRRAVIATGGRARFKDLAPSEAFADDEALPDLIEADGRARLEAGAPVSLDEYYAAAPDLDERPDALDAAIDVTLRSRSGAGRASVEAVESLVRERPHLETAIREAAALGDAVWSTTAVRRATAPRERPALPRDFGPLLESGARRYELREFLGAGAFGDVFLAVDRRMSDPDKPALVAIKIIAPAWSDAWDKKRLTEEANKARRAEHANIVRAIDRGETEEGEAYLVSEYVDGGTLAERSGRSGSPLPAREAARLTAQIARGLQAAHSAGLIHCDLKPSNILMTKGGNPKVSDFGIAVRAGESGTGESVSGAGRMGNIAFMSPEQYRRDDDAITAAADIYALGGILFWMLTGRNPNGETPEEIAERHGAGTGNREARSARSINPRVDRDLDLICRRALAPSRAERYAAAASLADDLESWLNLEPIRWTRPGVMRRMGLLIRRRPRTAAVSAGALVLALIGAGFGAHFASIAWQRQLEVEVTGAELRETSARNAATRGVLNTFAQMQQSRLDRVGPEVDRLGITWGIEWMGEHALMADPRSSSQLWSYRRKLIHAVAERTRSEDGESVEALLWESALGAWMLRDGEWEAAETLLAANEDAWRAILTRDDPMIGRIRALRQAAAVWRLKDEMGRRAPTASVAARARVLEAALWRAEDSLRGTFDSSPYRVAVLDALEAVYGEGLLNSPTGLERVELRRLEARGTAQAPAGAPPAEEAAGSSAASGEAAAPAGGAPGSNGSARE